MQTAEHTYEQSAKLTPWLRRHLSWKGREINRAFLSVLAAAIFLRVVTMLLYRPSVLQWVDGIRYLRISPRGFFGDPYSPAGYPAFLRALYFISSNLLVTIAAQHIVGLIGGIFIYLLVKRISGSTWLSLLPASIVFFSGDYIFLEHILMSETLFMTLVFISMYAAVRALGDPHPNLWLGISGVVMIASALVRPITLELPIVVAIWASLALGGSWRKRTLHAVATIVPAAALLVGYLALASSIGPYTGLNEMTGWDLYSRVAPFAECSKFTPPADTRVLCESVPASQRNGPFYYSWATTSPGLEHFPLTPSGAKKLEGFALRAIEGQPLLYLKAVVKDMIRYVDPGVGTERAYSGIPYSLYQFSYRTSGEQELIGKEIESKGYTDVLPVHSGGIPELEAYQAIFHVGGLPILVMAILAVAGMLLVPGRARAVIILLSICAFLMYLLPVLTLSYDVRYGWPPAPLLAAAAALSAYGLLARRSNARGGEAMLVSPQWPTT